MKNQYLFVDFNQRGLFSINEDYIYEGMIITYPLETTISSLKLIGVEQENIIITKDRNYYSIRVWRKYYDNIENIIKKSDVCGWYLSELRSGGKEYKVSNLDIVKEENHYIFLVFKAKYDIEIKDPPDIMYHTSPTKYRKSIMKKGIISKSKSKKFEHPERVYLTTTMIDCENIIKNLQGTEKESYDIYEIRVHNEHHLRIFKDPDYKDKGFYTLNSISPQSIKIVKTVDK